MLKTYFISTIQTWQDTRREVEHNLPEELPEMGTFTTCTEAMVATIIFGEAGD